MEHSKEHAEEVLSLLKLHYPHAKIILEYGNNWELLTAVILSAQCTDLMVNKVTSVLFPKYRNLNLTTKSKKAQTNSIDANNKEAREIINFAEIPIEELEKDIKSTGFYRNKAKSIKAAAKVVLEKYHGRIPKTMQEILKIPGVGRKTANVVLGNAYGISEGIAVDTHVRKQSQLLQLTTNTNPNKIEQDLMALYDKKDWFPLTYLLIEHGRATRKKRDANFYCPVCKGPCRLLALSEPSK